MSFKFLVNGQLWLLRKPLGDDFELLVVNSNHGKAIVMFTDEDLANRCMEEVGQGYLPFLVKNTKQALSILASMKAGGTDYVALDPAKQAPLAKIEAFADALLQSDRKRQ